MGTVTQNQETRVDLILSCPFLTYFIIIIHNINNGAYKTNKSRVFERFYTEIFSMKTSFDEFFIFYLLHSEIIKMNQNFETRQKNNRPIISQNINKVMKNTSVLP